MSLSTFLQQCLTGISLGGAYALIAIGYTLVYGILRLINFAHGDIFMMAGYFMIFAMATFPWYIAIPIVLLITVFLGVSIERVAYRPLRTAPRMSVMISAIGVSYLLQNLATYLFTALPKGYPEIPFLKKIFKIGGLSASFVTFLTPVLTLIIVYALIVLINKTKIGMAMRAVSKDYDTASLMGIKINRVITFTFAIGSLLAAVGSILYFTDRMTVFPFSGSLPGLKCFVAAVFGGIGSIPGAVIGGFILGLGETALVAMGYSTFSDAFTFVLLIIILLIKPTGLFGEKTTDKV
ncbi:branched-chain amino acid ABC transporter permease [Lacrimispora amygdalina]|jgi:branched-chain amino acid transport system permease protein|uniref:Branched-chain amino acid ABC transporter permease n=1 Tax=Lacrimispora amygdalina TaxID=253257 RepID=A0A3E2NBZ1_9FIRM|nr:branched-chain amino acid ABC transporter permease [Clostridium indicum]MBE5976836.1 branched-chain amino acid ABC transporter permease [Paenibacillaceae bacterium]MTK10535.1 branched-chain amino acid ABC transporter permease [Hungatella sp.]MBE5977822.1 branched-chain amino acid ABC transporter permease [Paenibacillaceae bacterium]MBE5992946.1 branched-chain amino acid ABC transporter permease [Paenibacillaceae bacterium]RFZ78525.1 branched-chain amino acid ABC transporter permease [Clostr